MVPSPPPKPPPETDELRDARQRLLSAIGKRRTTDRIVSVLWVVAPLIAILAASAIAVSVAVVEILDFYEGTNWEGQMTEEQMADLMDDIVPIIVPGTVIHVVAFTVLIFLLIDRTNKHARREQELRQALIDYVSNAASAAGFRSALAPELSTMEFAHMQSLRSEKVMSPAMLPLIFAGLGGISLVLTLADFYGAVPDYSLGFLGSSVIVSIATIVVTLYILYVLGQYNADHAIKWNNFSHGALYGLYKVGTPVMQPYYPKEVKERSFALYIILSVFTAGLFVYYWWYTLIKDPNEHYKSQLELEDMIIRAVAR